MNQEVLTALTGGEAGRPPQSAREAEGQLPREERRGREPLTPPPAEAEGNGMLMGSPAEPGPAGKEGAEAEGSEPLTGTSAGQLLGRQPDGEGETLPAATAGGGADAPGARALGGPPTREQPGEKGDAAFAPGGRSPLPTGEDRGADESSAAPETPMDGALPSVGLPPQADASPTGRTQPSAAADRSTGDGDAAFGEIETIFFHFDKLRAQEGALRAEFPDFSLDKALRDPAFLRLTAPGMGVSARRAWLALHPEAVAEKAGALAARESRALLGRALAAGAARPREGGGSGGALLRADYRNLSRPEQQRLKQRILEAAAWGEKLYP